MANEIGKKLKILREERKLTQQELSEKVGLSRCTISNYECGRRTAHLNELGKLANFFGVNIGFFGTETQDIGLELLSRAKSVFCNADIPAQERERLYREIMKMYLEM